MAQIEEERRQWTIEHCFGKLSDKSMLTAWTHALNVPGHRGKSQLRELGIVGRYWLSQQGPLSTIVVEYTGRMCSSHPAINKMKLLFTEWNCFSLAGIVARYRWYVCSRRIQLWAEFSDCPLTDSYVPPSPIPPSELLCSAHVSLRCMGNLEEFEEILQFL